MAKGGIPKEVLPLLFGISKVHPIQKICATSTKVLKRHGGEVYSRLVEICKGRNYLSMYNYNASFF